ncbi:hypothetical protein D3C73_185520 [compost metagenome]
MKAVPKVNTEGLYIEDTIVDDAFSGVVPFYAPLPEPALLEHGQESPSEQDGEDEELEREIAGYIVGLPVPQGLFMPRFDLVAWEDREEGDTSDQSYWVEGLTAEEIEELTTSQPQEPTEIEILTTQMEEVIIQNNKQQEFIDSAESEINHVKFVSYEQQQTISTLGSEQIKNDLSTLDLKRQNSVIGAELVKKDISILDLYMQNQVLGQMLAALELKMLVKEGESNV